MPAAAILAGSSLNLDSISVDEFKGFSPTASATHKKESRMCAIKPTAIPPRKANVPHSGQADERNVASRLIR